MMKGRQALRTMRPWTGQCTLVVLQYTADMDSTSSTTSTMQEDESSSMSKASPRLEQLRAESSELLRRALDTSDVSQEESLDLRDTRTAFMESNDAAVANSDGGDDGESPVGQGQHQAEVCPSPAPSEAHENADDSPSATTSSRRRPGSICYHWNCMIRLSYPYLLLLMVLVLWPAGIFALKSLLSKTDSTFHTPIAGSPSSAAQSIMQQQFPEAPSGSTNPTLLIVLQLNDKHVNTSLVHHDYAEQSSLGLESFLNKRVFGSTSSSNSSSVEVASFYGFRHANLSLLSRPFMSKDERTTFLQVALHLRGSNASSSSPKRQMDALMNAMNEYYYSYQQEQAQDVNVGFTGLNYFSNDLRVSTQRDLKRMDTLVLPLALLLVALTLVSQKSSQSLFRTSTSTNWRQKLRQYLQILPSLLLIPLCGMLSTVATWSICMNSLVVDHMQITQFTPSIMMSLTLGMGIDYSLFLLARFLEAMAKTTSTTTSTTTAASIQIMLEQAGQVVLVSGTTLLCMFLALVALPLPMLQSVGVGAAVAIASAILMNLLVTPALLYTPLLKNGLRLSSTSPSTWNQRNVMTATEPLLSSLDVSAIDEDASLQQPLLNGHEDDASFQREPEQQQQDSLWFRLAKQVLHPYKSIIIVLIFLQFLLWPVASNSRRLDSSDLSFESLLPQDAPSLQVYHRLVDPTDRGGGNFGPGKLAPFRIVLDGTPSNTTMDTPQAFDLQHDLVKALMAKNNNSQIIAGASFVGISVANNVPVPYSVYLASKKCGPTDDQVHVHSNLEGCDNDALRCLHFLDEQMLSSDRYTTYFVVELESVSPFDKEGIAWLEETRHRVDYWMKNQHTKNSQSKVQVYIDGTAAIAQDAVHAVYSSFPWVVASTLGVVFCLLGVVFRSVVPPLRSIVSISFTLAVSFGMAVLVYQDGIWDRWHIRSFTAVDPELSWLVPIMSFSIVVGLALDYDVFLVTRVLEFRWLEKYGHESSIAAGLDASGGIITSAGVIMALAFGSLLASQSPALDQWAFIVTTAVLLDTFVVRSLLVPAMMGWTGSKYSWYPRSMPIPQTRLGGFDLLSVEGNNDAILPEGRSILSSSSGRVQLEALLQEDEENDSAPRPPARRETLYYEAVEQPEDLASSTTSRPADDQSNII